MFADCPMPLMLCYYYFCGLFHEDHALLLIRLGKDWKDGSDQEIGRTDRMEGSDGKIGRMVRTDGSDG